jgi:AraC-like DNA-binding protein
MATEIAAPLMEAQATPVEKLIDNALAYIDRHYAKDISDADVARRIGLSTSYFRQVFRSATGQPFHRYLIGLRLEKARILLSEAGASVAQAADAVGFQNPAHFSRAFSQRFGGSPMRFRRG